MKPDKLKKLVEQGAITNDKDLSLYEELELLRDKITEIENSIKPDKLFGNLSATIVGKDGKLTTEFESGDELLKKINEISEKGC